MTLTLLPRGLSTSASMPTAHPSPRRRSRVSTTMSRTSSRRFMSAAPSVSAQAHDWGQPQLRSTPETKGAARAEARASSRGLLAPNWRIVGGWTPWVDMVRSIFRGGGGALGQWLRGWLRCFMSQGDDEEWLNSPLSRANSLRLNSLARIMGVQHRSTPYWCTVCRKASCGGERRLSEWQVQLIVSYERSHGGVLPCCIAPWGRTRRGTCPASWRRRRF